jgi:hypothetical protein
MVLFYSHVQYALPPLLLLLNPPLTRDVILHSVDAIREHYCCYHTPSHPSIMPKGSPIDTDNSTSPTPRSVDTIFCMYLITLIYSPTVSVNRARLSSLRNSIRLLAKICMPLPQS